LLPSVQILFASFCNTPPWQIAPEITFPEETLGKHQHHPSPFVVFAAFCLNFPLLSSVAFNGIYKIY
jgi:hypothetical protein